MNNQQKHLPKESVKALIKNEIEKIVPNARGKFWNSFQLRPKASFATQNQGETIYVLSRSHWIRNLPWIFSNFVYAVLPPFANLILTALNINIGELPAHLIYIFLLIYYSVILSNVIRDFFDWYFDPYVVTNERVLDFTFNPFSSYSVIEAPLESIVSVKQETIGFLGTVFNYADIVVQTQTQTQTITFSAAGNPSQVRDIIADLSRIARTYSYGD